MVESLFNLVFLIFEFEPVLICCSISFFVAVLGLIRRFIVGDFNFRRAS